ncbi:MAG: hypothetical protein ACLTE2_03830 [Eubacteriales bacterium]
MCFLSLTCASDVVDALKSYCTQNGVQIRQAVVTDLRTTRANGYRSAV